MGFQRACAVGEVPRGSCVAAEVGGVEIAVVHDDDEFYAIEDECSHAEIPLSEGDVEGCEIECWLHGSRFDLRTGKPTSLPATEPVAIYPVRLDGEDVLVDVTSPLDPG